MSVKSEYELEFIRLLLTLMTRHHRHHDDSAVSLVLPDVDTRKGKTLAFNTTGAVLVFLMYRLYLAAAGNVG